jgi:stearoyl-CoA desaturase (delta-9 desaturase)
MFRLTRFAANSLYLVGALGALYAVIYLPLHLLVVSLFVHILTISTFSAVMHRYFCHQAFKANPTFMWAVSLLPVAYGYATPMQWAVMHSAHHVYADTDKDPHIKGWKGVFTATYRDPPLRHLVATKWFRDAKHEWAFNYALVVVVLWQALLLSISLEAVLVVGLTPMFTLSFANGAHRALSHSINGARNLWFMEFLLPMGGEWIHGEHHKNAQKVSYANKWYEVDTGYWIIRALRR